MPRYRADQYEECIGRPPRKGKRSKECKEFVKSLPLDVLQHWIAISSRGAERTPKSTDTAYEVLLSTSTRIRGWDWHKNRPIRPWRYDAPEWAELVKLREQGHSRGEITEIMAGRANGSLPRVDPLQEQKQKMGELRIVGVKSARSAAEGAPPSTVGLQQSEPASNGSSVSIDGKDTREEASSDPVETVTRDLHKATLSDEPHQPDQRQDAKAGLARGLAIDTNKRPESALELESSLQGKLDAVSTGCNVVQPSRHQRHAGFPPAACL